jgi:tetratricopeptide (TPR) repeat protein
VAEKHERNLKRKLLTQLAALQACARLHRERGRYHSAEGCWRRGLAQLSRGAWPTPVHLSIWNELGIVYKYLGNFTAASKFYRLALKHSNIRVIGRERDDFLATLYHNLGGLEHARRHFRRGELYARKSLLLRRRTSAPGGVEVAADKVALAAILDGSRKFSESQKLYRQALRVYRPVYGTSHREIALILNNLAAMYQQSGRPIQAAKYYQAALGMKRRELGAAHPDVGTTMNNLGVFYDSEGRQRDAALYFNQALKLLETSLGKLHPNTRAVKNNLKKIKLNKAATPRSLSKRAATALDTR